MRLFNRKKRESGYERWQREEAEYRARPDYVSYARYVEILESMKDDPPQFDLLTEKDIQLMVTCLHGKGYISFGGGWRGTFGESYILMPSGSTPSVNQNTDIQLFARKEWALGLMARQLSRMHNAGTIKRIFEEAKRTILTELAGGTA